MGSAALISGTWKMAPFKLLISPCWMKNRLILWRKAVTDSCAFLNWSCWSTAWLRIHVQKQTIVVLRLWYWEVREKKLLCPSFAWGTIVKTLKGFSLFSKSTGSEKGKGCLDGNRTHRKLSDVPPVRNAIQTNPPPGRTDRQTDSKSCET